MPAHTASQHHHGKQTMKSAVQRAAVAALACLATATQADTLTEALLQGQMQQSFEGDVVASCGVVISGLELTSSGKALVFSGSFAVYDPGGGLVKGGANEIDAKDVGSSESLKRITPLNAENVWFKAQGAPRTVVLAGSSIGKAEDKGYIIYPPPFKPLSSLLQSVLTKQPIQVGVRVAGRKADQVLFGVVNMSDAQSEQLAQCVTEWTGAMVEKYKPKQ